MKYEPSEFYFSLNYNDFEQTLRVKYSTNRKFHSSMFSLKKMEIVSNLYPFSTSPILIMCKNFN